MAPPKKKRVTKGKPQPPSAPVIAHSSPPVSPYADGCLNVINDANQIAALVSLCFPVIVQKEFESYVVQHLDSVFSSISHPSFGEIDAIFSCLLSGYNAAGLLTLGSFPIVHVSRAADSWT